MKEIYLRVSGATYTLPGHFECKFFVRFARYECEERWYILYEVNII